MSEFTINVCLKTSDRVTAILDRALRIFEDMYGYKCAEIPADADRMPEEIAYAPQGADLGKKKPEVAGEALHEEAASASEVVSTEEAIPSKPKSEVDEFVDNMIANAPKYDAVYVRKVIAETRDRIEGVNAKSTDPGYKRYHKELTAMFKSLASTLSGGATDKPTELAENLIPQFASQCADFCIGEGGKIEIKLPF